MFAAKWCFAEQMNNSSQNKVEYLQKKKMKYVLLYMTKNKERKSDKWQQQLFLIARTVPRIYSSIIP